MSGPRILIIDIETAPALCYTFETRNVNISPIQIHTPVRMICFAAKWLDQKKIMFFSEWDDGTEVMVRAAVTLLDEADVVVTYNGDKFDLPHIDRERDLLNFEIANYWDPDDWGENPHIKPPSPFISVDLYKVVKKEQKWMSHKLAYITESLGLARKVEHYGFQLWIDVLAGDPKAQRLMKRYCRGDITVTEDVYRHYLPKIKNLPSKALWGDEVGNDTPECPCGSQNLHRRGYAVSKTRRYPRFQCQDCGKWLKGTRSEGGVTVS